MYFTASTVAGELMHDLALVVDLGDAERPQERIDERRRVAERLAERLADRDALGLQLLAGLAVGVPGLREFVGADFGEQRLALGRSWRR